jgi:heme-degrading monooxygenase HmoA
MTLWWASRDAFAGYMRSDDHRRSHARIPQGIARPTLIALYRYVLIAQEGPCLASVRSSS